MSPFPPPLGKPFLWQRPVCDCHYYFQFYLCGCPDRAVSRRPGRHIHIPSLHRCAMYYKPAWEVLQYHHYSDFRHNPNPPISNEFRVLPFPCYRHLMEARIFLLPMAFRNTCQRLMDPRWNPSVATRINRKRLLLRRFQDQGCCWESRKRLRDAEDDDYLSIRHQQQHRKRRRQIAETEHESEELADARRRFHELVILTGTATVDVGPTPHCSDVRSSPSASRADGASQPPSLSDNTSPSSVSILGFAPDTLADRRHMPMQPISGHGPGGAASSTSWSSAVASTSSPSMTTSPFSLASSSLSSSISASTVPPAPHSLPSPMPPASSLSSTSASSSSVTPSPAPPIPEGPPSFPSSSPSPPPPSLSTSPPTNATTNLHPPCSWPPPTRPHILPPSLTTSQAPQSCARHPHQNQHYSSLAWLLEEQSVNLSALDGYLPLPYSHHHHHHQQQQKGDYRSHVCYENHEHAGYHNGVYKLDEQVLAQARAANWWAVDPEGSLSRLVGEFFARDGGDGSVAWGYGWFLNME